MRQPSVPEAQLEAKCSAIELEKEAAKLVEALADYPPDMAAVRASLTEIRRLRHEIALSIEA